MSEHCCCCKCRDEGDWHEVPSNVLKTNEPLDIIDPTLLGTCYVIAIRAEYSGNGKRPGKREVRIKFYPQIT